MQFHHVIALLWHLFSCLITVILYHPTLKNVGSLSIPVCLHGVEVGWRENDCLPAWSPEKQQLVGPADHPQSVEKVEPKVRLAFVKQKLKCSSEFFPSVLLTQKSLWPRKVDFCQRVFLKIFLSCFWQLRPWRGFSIKPLALRLGYKSQNLL